jgi:DNA-binding MarR family transcriptional regulator
MAKSKKETNIGLWQDFLRSHAQVSSCIESDLQDRVGFPLTWYDVLFHLSEAPKSKLRLQDLADKLLFSRSGLTRLIDRIEQAGFVVREPDPHDRRGVSAVLTTAGRKALRRAAPTHTKGVDRYFLGALTGADKKALQALFAKIIASSSPAP